MPIDGSSGVVDFAVAAVLAHLAAVGEQEIDPLGAVERAAAADGDDRIERAVLPGERRAARDHGAVGILREVRERHDGERRGFERALYRRGVTGLDDAGVGDEQRAAET